MQPKKNNLIGASFKDKAEFPHADDDTEQQLN